MGNLIWLNYSKNYKIFIWLTQEFAIIAADIQEILGAVIGLNILTGLKQSIGVFVIILCVIGILFLQEFGQKAFEGSFLILVGILGICMFINFFQSDVTFINIIDGFIPSIPKGMEFISVVGSIIMPQNIFLHASLV